MQQVSERDKERRIFFDSHAEEWEKRNYSPEVLRRVEYMLAGLGLKRGASVLDVGCGQGVLVPFLRSITGENARIIALDASAPMLREIARKDPYVTAIHAPAEKLPLIDAYVDVVICFAAFPHFSDKAAAVREFYRVLNPGGTVHILHLMGSEALAGHHGKHPAVQGDCLPCAEEMRSMFGEAGFSHMELRDEPGLYSFAAVKPGATHA